MNSYTLSQIKEKLIPNSKVKIITNFISLKALHLLQPLLQNCESIQIILTNKNFCTNNNVDKTLLFTNFAELQQPVDLYNGYYAKEFTELLEHNIEIKCLKPNGKNINFSFMLINDNFSIDNIDSITLNNLDVIESDEWTNLQFNEDHNIFNNNLNKFKQIWFSNDVEDIKAQYIQMLNHYYENKSAKQIYDFCISHIFKNRLSDSQDLNLPNYHLWKKSKIYQSLYEFQKNAVFGILNKINKYNGCILADSVGLGKTYEALAVIKYFELQRKKVLVLVPKKLKNNWLDFLQNSRNNPLLEDNFNYTVMSHTDLSRTKGMSGIEDLSKFDWSNFDLVVIDESHNFRNYSWTDDIECTKSRYQLLMENIILNGRNTQVLLLTATPVNNKMQDIANQIKLITQNNDDALQIDGIDSINKVCAHAERKSQLWSELNDNEKTTERFQEMIGLEFRKLMDTISIARSRKQILNVYQNVDIKFPKRLSPINIYTNIDTNGDVWNIKELSQELQNLFLACYKPTSYILDEYVDYYASQDDNFKQWDRENSLVNLIQMNLLKRFESSIQSFRDTLQNIIDKTEFILQALTSNSSLETDNDFNDNAEDDSIFEYKKYSIKKSHLDVYKYSSDLESDLVILNKIANHYKNIDVTRDEKLWKLFDLITNKINNPINNNNQKILIFTTFIDTANYLYENINKHFPYLTTALVTGQYAKWSHNTPINQDQLLIYFSPQSKMLSSTNLDPTKKVDILIATDCISEGQNLQDCDYLINYDIHWNPVRIIQRFGRIDRIGSINDKIQLVNMWPNLQLDEYIQLENRVKTKMQKVTFASTNDDNILEHSHNNSNNSYRLNQLKQLQKEILDLEDIKGDVSFSHLTLNDFVVDLQKLSSVEKEAIQQWPHGVFSIVSADDVGLVKGAIFLLKNNDFKDEKNIIAPYRLVYVADNQKIIYSHWEPGQILNILKQLSLHDKVINTKTDCSTLWSYLTKYTNLLNVTIENQDHWQHKSNLEILFDQTTEFDYQQLKFELIAFIVLE